MFAKPPEGYAASDVYERLKERGIYVRYFRKERISDYLRITIGTDEEMDALIAFFNMTVAKPMLNK